MSQDCRLFLLLSLLAVATARADQLGVGIGRGEDITAIGGSIQFDRRQPVRQFVRSRLIGQLEIVGGQITSNRNVISSDPVGVVGITPRVMWQFTECQYCPYTSLGIGFRYITRTRLDDTELGTHFQFGEVLALGWRFGSRRQWDLSTAIQHISNGGISSDNDGFSFVTTRLGWEFTSSGTR